MAFAPLPCNIKIKIILCCIKTAFIHMQVFNTLTYSILKSRRTLHIAQMANPKTVTMQYVDLFSHLTAQLPSVELSQKHVLAVCSPAPFFCMMIQFTIYLKGFPSLLRWLRQSSTTLLLHWFTLVCWYVFPPIVASIDSFIILLTSSTTNVV